MGRPPKRNLNYSTWDVDVLENDTSIDNLIDAQGPAGFYVYFALCQKTRTAVAAALGISSAQAGKYQAIYKHLCPTLMQRYKAGTIGTQVAYELSSLPNRQQEEIAATYPVPTMEAVRKKKESVPETFPDWVLPMAKEFVNKKWVRKLEHFSAAALQALATTTGGTNRCGGITDTSAKGIRFYLGGQHVQYTWAQFVKACAGVGITPEPMPKKATAEPKKAPVTRAERYATFINDNCTDTQFLVLPNGGENFILLFCHGKCPPFAYKDSTHYLQGQY